MPRVSSPHTNGSWKWTLNVQTVPIKDPEVSHTLDGSEMFSGGGRTQRGEISISVTFALVLGLETPAPFETLMNTIQGSAMLRLTRSRYRFTVPRKPSSVIARKRTLRQNGYGTRGTFCPTPLLPRRSYSSSNGGCSRLNCEPIASAAAISVRQTRKDREQRNNDCVAI